MALDTPTTQEINDTILAQLEASLNQVIPLLPRSFLRVLAKTIAAVFTLLYKCKFGNIGISRLTPAVFVRCD